MKEKISQLPAKIKATSPHGQAQHQVTKQEKMMWQMNDWGASGSGLCSTTTVGAACSC